MLQQQGLANFISSASRQAFHKFLIRLGVDQSEGTHWFRDYFTPTQNLVAILAKSKFHTACQDYKTAFIGCNDNICIGIFFISVLQKVIFKKLKSLICTT